MTVLSNKHKSLTAQIQCFIHKSVLFGCSALVLLAYSPACGFASDNKDDSLEVSLGKLENKLFLHDYVKDTIDTRLERIEKMVFGDPQTGSNEERVKNLLASVNVDTVKPTPQKVEQQDSSKHKKAHGKSKTENVENNHVATDSGDGLQDFAPDPMDEKLEEKSGVGSRGAYPAVAAIEKKVLGKDYPGELIADRLKRLEVKLFGAESKSKDLSERVDLLKAKSGVDLAKLAPANSDWADESDVLEIENVGPSKAHPSTNTYSTASTDDDEDLSTANSGSYGFNPRPTGTAKPASPGNFQANGLPYGYGKKSNFFPGASNPYSSNLNSRTANSSGLGLPGQSMPGQPMQAPGQGLAANGVVAGMGLNQQVAALEVELFGKGFAKDTLPERVTRLESAVFPQAKDLNNKPLPTRVNDLLAVIPLTKVNTNNQVAATKGADEDDLGFDDQFDQMFARKKQQMANQMQQAQGGGFSKVINSIAGILGGGGMGGGYASQPGGLVQDPQTGLLLDPYSGALIDPMTGAVVGRRMVSGMGGGSTLGGSSFGGFGSGMSPYGATPYGGGYGSGMRFGFGSGGIGIGGMGIGGW